MLLPTKAESAPQKTNLLTALSKVLPKNELHALTLWVDTFYSFQQDWLLESARFAMCLKARQTGLSHTSAAAAVLWSAFLGETTTVVSVGEDEALEVVALAEKHAVVLQRLGSTWARCKRRGNQLVFERGGRIIAKPATTGGRGLSGNVILDEFAYHRFPDVVWDGASAVTTHGYRLRVLSTPNGVGNAFHKLWTNEKQNKGWAKHSVPLERALASGMKDQGRDTYWSMAKGDQRIYNQLFKCSFLDGNEQYIPTDLILGAVDPNPIVQRELGVFYAGYDVGLQNDLSVLVILAQTQNNHVYVQAVDAHRRTDFEEQKEAIYDGFTTFPIKKLCIDSSGMGIGLAESVQKRLGRARVEPVVFSLQSKEQLATDLYQAFADKMISIPDDQNLIKDLLSLRRIITSSGNVRYDAPQTVDGHADRAWALALAIHACSHKPSIRKAMGPGDFGNT